MRDFTHHDFKAGITKLSSLIEKDPNSIYDIKYHLVLKHSIHDSTGILLVWLNSARSKSVMYAKGHEYSDQIHSHVMCDVFSIKMIGYVFQSEKCFEINQPKISMFQYLHFLYFNVHKCSALIE